MYNHDLAFEIWNRENGARRREFEAPPRTFRDRNVTQVQEQRDEGIRSIIEDGVDDVEMIDVNQLATPER